MTLEEQHLDGNAAGGLLGQVFAFDMTAARITCAGCGRDGVVAETPVYASAMGTVVRCPGCGDVLLRVAQSPDRVWFDFGGTGRLVVYQ